MDKKQIKELAKKYDAHLYRPTFIYDGDCPFCCRWAGRLKKMTRGCVLFRPYQEGIEDLQEKYPTLTLEKCKEAVQLLEKFDNGSKAIVSGAEAIFAALDWSRVTLYQIPHVLYIEIPPFAWLSEAIYRWIAKSRICNTKRK